LWESIKANGDDANLTCWLSHERDASPLLKSTP
jgi:hypothetical protein